MSAVDQAARAYRRAVAAAAREDAEAARKASAEGAARQARLDHKWAAALEILNRPGWFPGIEWELVDDGEAPYYSDFVVREKTSDPGDPLKLKIDGTRVYVVEGKVLDDHYHHWVGPEVKSAADVGRWLLERNS